MYLSPRSSLPSAGCSVSARSSQPPGPRAVALAPVAGLVVTRASFPEQQPTDGKERERQPRLLLRTTSTTSCFHLLTGHSSSSSFPSAMRDGNDRAGQQAARPFTSRPDPHFTPYAASHDDRRSQANDELDEIQQEFEALTRWSREAEWAARAPHVPRAASPRTDHARQGRELSSPVLGGNGREGALALSQDWRRILAGGQLGSMQHARAESDASVEVLDLSVSPL